MSLRYAILVTSMLCAVSCITLAPVSLSPMCSECKEVVGSIQNAMINANKTYEQIVEKNLDEQVCANLPADVQESCRNIVDEQIPAIWSSVIMEYMDPDGTCKSLHLCGPSGFAEGDAITCHICKKAAQFIDVSIFEDPIVQKKVASNLKAICGQLPKVANSTIAQCEKLIDDDISDIMEEIGKAVAASMCVDLELCPVHAAPTVVAVTPVCDGCVSVVGKIQAAVFGASTGLDSNMRDFLEAYVCSKLGPSQESCVAAAPAAAAAAWPVVGARMEPVAACRTAHLCGAAEWAGATAAGGVTGDAAECRVCRKAAEWIDTSVLEDPEIQREVAERLKSLCTQLPNPRISNTTIVEQCDKLVDDNTADIMNQIGKVVATRLCEDLDMCPV